MTAHVPSTPSSSTSPGPAQWAAVYDDPAETGRGFVFRQGADIAFQCCGRYVQRGQIWIDAGCGPGHLAARLAGLGLQVAGLDCDGAALEWARERWLRSPDAAGKGESEITQVHKRSKALRFIRGSVAALPLRDGCASGFVGVSLAGCLRDFEAFLKESRRVLRPGGRLILTVTNRASLLLRVNHGLQRIESRLTGRRFDPHRYTAYHPAAVLRSLQSAGFLPLHLAFYNYVVNLGPWLLPPRFVASRLCRAASPDGAKSLLARNFVVVAERR